MEEIKKLVKKDHLDFTRKLRYIAKSQNLDYNIDFKILTLFSSMRNALHSDSFYTGDDLKYSSKSGKLLELKKNTNVEFGGYPSKSLMSFVDILDEIVEVFTLIEISLKKIL